MKTYYSPSSDGETEYAIVIPLENRRRIRLVMSLADLEDLHAITVSALREVALETLKREGWPG